MLYRIYPSRVLGNANPGFVDNIFASRLVVFAARLVLFSVALVLAFAAAYIIWSIVNWFKLRQWLVRAGPFQVSEASIEALKDEVESWRSEAVALKEQVRTLSRTLEEFRDVLPADRVGTSDEDDS